MQVLASRYDFRCFKYIIISRACKYVYLYQKAKCFSFIAILYVISSESNNRSTAIALAKRTRNARSWDAVTAARRDENVSDRSTRPAFTSSRMTTRAAHQSTREREEWERKRKREGRERERERERERNIEMPGCWEAPKRDRPHDVANVFDRQTIIRHLSSLRLFLSPSALPISPLWIENARTRVS